MPFHLVINPVLEIVDEAPRDFFEGCLSAGDFRARVRRAHAVRVTGLDEKAEPVELHAEGWYARILQHEFDHLEGTPCIDRMEPRSFSTPENYARHFLRARRTALLWLVHSQLAAKLPVEGEMAHAKMGVSRGVGARRSSRWSTHMKAHV